MDQVTDVWSSIEAAFAGFREGLNGILYTMSKQHSKSKFLFILGTAIESLQMVEFTLPRASVINLAFPAAIVNFSEAISMVNIAHKLIDLLGELLTVAITVTYLGFLLAALMYVANSWAKKEFHILWPIRLLRLCLQVTVGVLYIPIVTVLSTVFSCSKFNTATECTVSFPFAIAGLLAIISMAFLSVVTLFDPHPTSASPYARPHSRIHVVQLFVKTVCSILYPLVPSIGAPIKIVWTVLVMVLCLILAFLFTWYQPYYRKSSTLGMALTSCIQAWFAVCSFAHFELNSTNVATGSFTTLMIFGGLVLVIPLSWFAVHHRWYNLSFMPINKCGNVYELELRARFELQSKPATGDVLERAEIVHSWYMEMDKQFPFAAPLHVFHAYFILDYLPHRPSLVRRSILMAERIGLSFDYAFLVYRAKKALDEDNGSFNVMRLVQSDILLEEAIGYDRQCSHELVNFWSELAQRKPNMEKVRNLTQTIAMTSTFARQKYNELLRLNPHSANTLKLLGSFLIDVVNDSQTGTRMLKKASHIDANADLDTSDRLNKVSTDSLGVLLIRGGNVILNRTTHVGGPSVVGEIIKANAHAGRLLNEISNSLIGKRVQSFMVPPLSLNFQDIMKEYLKEGNDRIFLTNHKSFMRTKDGALLPVDISFKPYVGEGSEFLVYVIFADSDVRKDVKSNFVLVTEQGEYVGGSQEFLSVFFMHINEHRGLMDTSQMLQMTKILRNFSGLLKSFLSEGTNSVPIRFDEGNGLLFFENEVDSSNDELPEGSLTLEPYEFLGTNLIQVFLTLPSQEASEQDQYSEGDFLSENGEESLPVLLRNQTSETGVRFQEEKPSMVKGGTKISRLGSKASSIESVDRIRKKAVEVRRVLVQSSKAQMDTTLKQLRKVYFRATMLIMLVSVADFLYCNNLLSDFQTNVNFIGQIGFRRTLALNIAFAAHSLVLVNLGVLDKSFETSARTLLNESSFQLKSTDSELFYLRSKVTSDFIHLYEDRTVKYMFLRDDSIEVDTLSLYDSVLRLSSTALQAAATVRLDDTFHYNNSLVFPMLSNIVQPDRNMTLNEIKDGDLTILEALERSTDMYTEHVRDTLDRVLLTFESLSIGLCVFTTLSLIRAIRPLVGNGGKIENTKREVLRVFQCIPKRAAQEVAERFISRLAEVHNEAVDFPEGGQESTEEAQFNTAKSSTTPRKKSSTRILAQRIMQGKKLRCMSVQKFSILIKMGSLLIASFIYFSSVIVLIANTNLSLRGSPSTANYAGFRRTRSLHMSHELRLYLSGAFRDPDSGLVEMLESRSSPLLATDESLRERANNLLLTHNKIMHGSPSEYITGTFHETYSRSDVAFSQLLDVYSLHGCDYWPTDINTSHTKAECENFMGGILGSGLHNALVEFVALVDSLSRDSVIKEKAAIASIPSVSRDLFANEKVKNIIEMEAGYLQTQLNTVIRLHAQVTQSIIAREKTIMLSVTVTFLITALSCYFLIVRRLLYGLDLDVKRTRALLLVIPEDLFYSLGEVQRFLLDQFGNMSSAGSVRGDHSRGAVVPA